MQLTSAPQHNGGENESAESEDEGSVDIIMDDGKNDVMDKDESEEELERLVFGDSAGFKAGLHDFALDPAGGAYGGETDEDEDETEDIKEVPDQDLFFFDSGPQAVAGAVVPATKTEEEDDEEADGGKPAWEDSDDERVVVSLASMPRLKKLRETAEDDLINGKEYVRRLRRQYQSLYPTPDWALEATGKSKRKRTRPTEDGESEDESLSEMDEDDDDLSTQPLARLLKDADILSRTSSGPLKKRKLQSGVVDIQRLKDVSKRGPVRCCHMPYGNYANLSFSLQLLLFLSILPILSSSPPVLVLHFPYTTSTPTTRTIPTHYLLLSI
jgi:U3 small nucleolar RNA-associated protein 18